MPDEIKFTDVTDIAEQTAKRPEPEPVPPAPEKKNTPEFLALKSTFLPSRGDMGGGFCVVFEGKTGKTVFQVFWLAKPYASGVMVEPSKDWRTFVKRLPQFGPLDKDWGEKFQEQLKGILTTEEKRKLFENYTKVKVRQLESIFRRSFENIAQCVFSAVTDVEPVARNELERAKIIKPLPPSPEQLAKKNARRQNRKKRRKKAPLKVR